MTDPVAHDPDKPLRDFLARFRENYVACDLARIGGSGDGGYLLPNNLARVKYCFSPGVGRLAGFEMELKSAYGIQSFMADASVEPPEGSDAGFVFIKKFLGNRTHGDFITLSDWVRDSIGEDDGTKILQMDIEGAEYDVLIYESVETLASFSTLVIEFHGLGRLFDRSFLSVISTIFEKIYKNFSICHVHPNNCCGLVERNGISVPRLMEITFMRNDLLEPFRKGGLPTVPHPLDERNVMAKEDIRLPEIWWKG